MKKELRILVILIAVLLVGTVGYYFMPKKFGKNVNPSEVDHINVFDGCLLYTSPSPRDA